jgi:hypothetical protein
LPPSSYCCIFCFFFPLFFVFAMFVNHLQTGSRRRRRRRRLHLVCIGFLVCLSWNEGAFVDYEQ